MNRGLLDQVRADQANKRAVVVATDLGSGAQTLVHPWEDDDPAPPWLRDAAREAARADQSREVDGPDGTVFLQVHNPPLRLILVGAVHIAQHLAQMAAMTGFEVVVVDPRRAWATEARFPGVSLVTTWPQEAFADLAPDRRTAVVTLTHDAKIDDPALQEALRSPAFYVGALGSTRTRDKRFTRLRAAGFVEEDLARIHGPVGLDIGARSTAEIAVAVLAQVIERLRKGAG